jgi:hypothetical protein
MENIIRTFNTVHVMKAAGNIVSKKSSKQNLLQNK